MSGVVRHICVVCVLAVLCACNRGRDAPSDDALTVFAAASTTNVITELAELYEQEHGARVTCSFDASSTLARQILAGAPADVFLSANPQWMDALEQAAAIRTETRTDLFANRLVLIVPAEAPLDVRIERGVSLAETLPGVRRLAIGDPTHVPAGQYAKDALEWLGWWEAAMPMLIPALDVRSALRLVEIGEADAGVVYATDAAASERVAVAGTFPESSHAPIRYPIAACAGADAGAAEFIEFLRTPSAMEVFAQHGFEPAAVASDAP